MKSINSVFHMILKYEEPGAGLPLTVEYDPVLTLAFSLCQYSLQ